MVLVYHFFQYLTRPSNKMKAKFGCPLIPFKSVQYYHMFMIRERREKMNRNDAAAIIEERDRRKVTPWKSKNENVPVQHPFKKSFRLRIRYQPGYYLHIASQGINLLHSPTEWYQN